MSSNTPTNILDLPDDCLYLILDKVVTKNDKLSWSKVCGRFCRIYSDSFARKLKSLKYEESLLDDHIATHCAHLIGTQYSPLEVIKTVRLKGPYTWNFWKNLSKQHPEIEEAELVEVSECDLKMLLPLPNLKRLKCTDSRKRIRPAQNWHAIVELYNPDHGLNSLRYAPALNHLDTLEEVEIDCHVYKWWSVLGKLPNLKVLTLNKFNVNKCDYSNASCVCGVDRIQYLVTNLLKFNKLEKLTFQKSWMAESTMNDIVKLTSLKRLCLLKTIQEDELTLNMFSGLVNLEELHIGNLILNKTATWRFFRMCGKLKYLRIFSRNDNTAKIQHFISRMLKSRIMEGGEPIKVVVCKSYFDSIDNLIEIFEILSM